MPGSRMGIRGGAMRPSPGPRLVPGPFPRVGIVSSNGFGGVMRRRRFVRPLRVPTAPAEPELSTPTEGPAAAPPVPLLSL